MCSSPDKTEARVTFEPQISNTSFFNTSISKSRNSNTLSNWWEELTYWKRSWYWERLRAGGKGQQRMGQLDDITDSMDMCAKSFQLCPTLGPYRRAHQALLSTGFSRKKYESGLLFPSRELPDPGIEPKWQTGSLPLVPPEHKFEQTLGDSKE